MKKFSFLATAIISGLLMVGSVFANSANSANVLDDANNTQDPSVEDPQFIIDEHSAIDRVSNRWAKSLNNGKSEKTASFYEKEVSLYATFKVKVDTYSELLEYFEQLNKKSQLKVVFNEKNIRVFGPTAVNSGLYTFSYVENGKVVEVPARFTFVYTLTSAGWKIVDHHSSVFPE